jgi:hypothetical protein
VKQLQKVFVRKRLILKLFLQSWKVHLFCKEVKIDLDLRNHFIIANQVYDSR